MCICVVFFICVLKKIFTSLNFTIFTIYDRSFATTTTNNNNNVNSSAIEKWKEVKESETVRQPEHLSTCVLKYTQVNKDKDKRKREKNFRIQREIKIIERKRVGSFEHAATWWQWCSWQQPRWLYVV